MAKKTPKTPSLDELKDRLVKANAAEAEATQELEEARDNLAEKEEFFADATEMAEAAAGEFECAVHEVLNR